MGENPFTHGVSTPSAASPFLSVPSVSSVVSIPAFRIIVGSMRVVSGDPLAQLREILLHVRDHLLAGAERLVFVMLAQQPCEIGRRQIREEAALH